jgi:hypothetical protein
LEDEFWLPLPPEASEMPLKREPEAVSSLPLDRIEGETIASKGCQVGSKPSPGSYSSALLKKLLFLPPATSTLPEGSSVAVCDSRAVVRLPVAVQLGSIIAG